MQGIFGVWFWMAGLSFLLGGVLLGVIYAIVQKGRSTTFFTWDTGIPMLAFEVLVIGVFLVLSMLSLDVKETASAFALGLLYTAVSFCLHGVSFSAAHRIARNSAMMAVIGRR